MLAICQAELEHPYVKHTCPVHCSSGLLPNGYNAALNLHGQDSLFIGTNSFKARDLKFTRPWATCIGGTHTVTLACVLPPDYAINTKPHSHPTQRPQPNPLNYLRLCSCCGHVMLKHETGVSRRGACPWWITWLRNGSPNTVEDLPPRTMCRTI